MNNANVIGATANRVAPDIQARMNVSTFGRAHEEDCTDCAFATRLAAALPEVVAVRMDPSDQGILHLEVGALKLATRDAVELGNWDDVCEHFRFAERVYETADESLRDAIEVSYIGMLFCGESHGNYARARTLLPARLALALQRIERRYEALEKGVALQNGVPGKFAGASSGR